MIAGTDNHEINISWIGQMVMGTVPDLNFIFLIKATDWLPPRQDGPYYCESTDSLEY